jgi:hypothetical protein
METGRGDESLSLLDEAIRLAPDLDPLDIFYMGTRGKVQSLEMFLLNSMPAAGSGDQSDRPRAQPAPRKQRKKQPKRRR